MYIDTCKVNAQEGGCDWVCVCGCDGHVAVYRLHNGLHFRVDN